MSSDAMDSRLLAEFDPNWGVFLKCDVELNVEGSTKDEVVAATVKALRETADRIEARSLDTGFHTVADATGKSIGEAYLDFSEGDRI